MSVVRRGHCFSKTSQPLITPWRTAGRPKVADRTPIAQGKPTAFAPRCARPRAARVGTAGSRSRLNEAGERGKRWMGDACFSGVERHDPLCSSVHRSVVARLGVYLLGT